MSGDVQAIEYKHAQSRTRAAYRHDFNSGGVELWALDNGALLIRKPGVPLWDTFTVSDKE